jgi:hypothetical protein
MRITRIFPFLVLAFALLSAPVSRAAVTVHGHWTIDVYTRDGKLVSHNEFENALQPAGAAFIATSLAGTDASGLWRIAATAVEPGKPPCRGPLTNDGRIVDTACLILNPLDSNLFGTHAYRTGASTVSGGKLILTGSADVINTTSINLVVTFPSSMGFTLNAFDNGSTEGFTRAILPTPIPVQAEQVIKVRVEISFS